MGVVHKSEDLDLLAVTVPAGSWDIALASFSADGAHRWSRLFGDDSIQIGPRVAMSENGRE